MNYHISEALLMTDDIINELRDSSSLKWNTLIELIAFQNEYLKTSLTDALDELRRLHGPSEKRVLPYIQWVDRKLFAIRTLFAAKQYDSKDDLNARDLMLLQYEQIRIMLRAIAYMGKRYGEREAYAASEEAWNSSADQIQAQYDNLVQQEVAALGESETKKTAKRNADAHNQQLDIYRRYRRVNLRAVQALLGHHPGSMHG